ncbi:MAG: exodeoxyribonuclease VII small subunit [Dorea sp.]|nr:exodeoxyribonuclease VII small subunit [Dorea sp.]MDY2812699.1 exodeoxyribonuclease VII small subunit [Dorea sp.]
MDNGEQNLQEQTLEELFVQLEETMKKMEQEDVSLEDSFQYYHRGMDLLKVCNDKIDQVEKKMLVLDEEGGTHEF